MSGKLRQLHETKEWGAGSAPARVVKTEEGEARLVMLEGETVSSPIAGHLCDAPLLKPGDRVLVSRTAGGIILLGRLRSPGERPRPRLEEDADGRLLVEAAGGICLQVGEARLEITPDGRIRVDGKEIYGLAAGRLRLQGALIELN